MPDDVIAPAEPVIESAPADWTSAIPADLAKEKLWDSVRGKPLSDVLKGYASAQQYIGGAVKLPKDDAPAEEWAAFHRKLGVPEAPDKYAVELPPLPEDQGAAWDEAGKAEFLKAAHANGLTPKQVKGVLDWYAGYVVTGLDKRTTQTAEARKVAETTLEKEWGPRTGATFQRNVSLAKATVQRLFAGDQGLLELAEARGNDPAWVKGLALIGQRMLESGEITSDITPSDQASVDARIKEIREQLTKGEVGGARRQQLNDQLLELYRQRPAGREVVSTL